MLARALLGKSLVHGDRRGYIMETEAYLGPEDAASHARFGVTKRNEVMYGPGGVAYVYLCYGVHEMFNVVSGRDGAAGAVLVRAVDMTNGDASVGRGPGKLTRALGLSREHTGTDLSANERLYIAAGRRIRPDDIAVGPRIGIDYAGDWIDAPLRFWVGNSDCVSRTR